VPLDRVLAESDIVSLHVPLTEAGPDATYHMADARFFERLNRGAIFLNCARGGATDTDALLSAMQRGLVRHAVIDTWEHEPDCRADLLARCDITTPHIAGHSFDGRVMGTVMVYREACRFLGVTPAWTPEPFLPAPPVPEIAMDVAGMTDERSLREIVRRVYDIEGDDRRMRAACAGDVAARVGNFDVLRREYPMRREFRFTRLTLSHASPALLTCVRALGFQIS